MNILDVIFLILILGSVIYSLIRGLVREIFSFLSIILGFLGASYGYASVAAWLGRWIENQTLTQILGFALLFILIALLISLLGKALASLVKKMDLSWVDRLGGAAFGLLKAILLIAIILLVLTAFLPPQSKLILESKISPRIMAFWEWKSDRSPRMMSAGCAVLSRNIAWKGDLSWVYPSMSRESLAIQPIHL